VAHISEFVLVDGLSINRLSWCGYVVRMDPQRSAQKVFNSKPYGSRKTERPKVRWEGVLQDIRALDIKNWRDIEMRNGKDFFGRSRPTLGCLACDDDDGLSGSYLLAYLRS
jgi:hypothetical protein